MEFVAVVITVAVILALVYVLFKGRTDDEASGAEWEVMLINGDQVESHTFDLLQGEVETLETLTNDELEDEAASRAMFTAYTNIDKVSEQSVLVVISPSGLVFQFAPDYEHGHLVGVCEVTFEIVDLPESGDETTVA